MASFDYFKQYVSEMERIKAETAHQEHIVQFHAMCAKMIQDAIPDIKQHCIEECMKEVQAKYHLKEPDKQEARNMDVHFKVNVEDVKKSIMDALRRAFK